MVLFILLQDSPWTHFVTDFQDVFFLPNIRLFTFTLSYSIIQGSLTLSFSYSPTCWFSRKGDLGRTCACQADSPSAPQTSWSSTSSSLTSQWWCNWGWHSRPGQRSSSEVPRGLDSCSPTYFPPTTETWSRGPSSSSCFKSSAAAPKKWRKTSHRTPPPWGPGYLWGTPRRWQWNATRWVRAWLPAWARSAEPALHKSTSRDTAQRCLSRHTTTPPDHRARQSWKN